jgi:hypothetical protein
LNSRNLIDLEGVYFAHFVVGAVRVDNTPITAHALCGRVQHVSVFVFFGRLTNDDGCIGIQFAVDALGLDIFNHVPTLSINVRATPLASKPSPWHAWHLFFKGV